MNIFAMNNRDDARWKCLIFMLTATAVSVMIFTDGMRLNACMSEDDLTSTVELLVHRLNSPIRIERNEAERALLECGLDVLPFLPTETMLISAEVRIRLDRIRRTLENESFLELQSSPPIPMTEGRTTLALITEELTSRSGNHVKASEESAERIIEWSASHPLSFWPTLDRICELSGSRFERSSFGQEGGSSRELELILAPLNSNAERNPDLLFTQVEYYGPFRIAYRSDISSETRETFRLTTSLWWEPRLRVIRFDVPHVAYGGLDGSGNQFQASTPNAVLEIPVDGKAVSREWTVGMKVVADTQQDGSSAPPQFVAQFEAIVLGGDHEFIFEDVSRYPTTRTYGDATVVLEQARETSSGWELDIRVTYDEVHGAFASHYSWYYANQAVLLDREGETECKIETSSSMIRSQFENGFVMTYAFPRMTNKQIDIESTSFSYTAPAFLRSIPIGSE
jgi:hypothetical protein